MSAPATKEISDWLEKLGMSEYTQRFAENRIDLSVLPYLTDQHLKDLGVALGDRLKMLHAIAELTGSSAAAHHAPTSRRSWRRISPRSALRSRRRSARSRRKRLASRGANRARNSEQTRARPPRQQARPKGLRKFAMLLGRRGGTVPVRPRPICRAPDGRRCCPVRANGYCAGGPR